jgi:hypothetical protein
MKTLFFELDIDPKFSILCLEISFQLVGDAPTYLVRPHSLSSTFSRVRESERLGVLTCNKIALAAYPSTV